MKNFSRLDFIQYIINYNPKYFEEKNDVRFMLESFHRDFIGVYDYNDIER